jgi:hypothetical protein
VPATERTTRPVALRMTDPDRDRLLSYGATPRAAVTRLLEIAEEHERCPEPARPEPAPIRAPFVTPLLARVSYTVDRDGEEPLTTTDHELALRTARAHGTRVRRSK